MPDQLQLRGGTTVQHAAFTGASKEVTVDTTKKTVVVHDGSTVGGSPVMREDASNSALILGSAASPSLKFTGDANTGLYSPGADQVAVATGGTERLRIDASGQIEAVSLGTAAAPTYSFTTDPNTGIYSPGADQVAISTNGTGRLFVDSAGRLSLGTSTLPAIEPHSNVSAGASLPTFRSLHANQQYGIVFCNDSDTTAGYGSALFLARTRSSTLGGFTIVQNGDTLGTISFAGADGSDIRTKAATIFGAVDGTPNADDMPGRLVFSTTPSGAASPVERMRLDSSGRLGLGTSSPGATLDLGSGTLRIRNAPGDSNGLQIYQDTSDVSRIYNFYPGPIAFGTNNTERVRITSGGLVGIGTTSPAGTLSVNNASANSVIEVTRGAAGAGYGYTIVGADGATTPALRFQTISNGVWGSEVARFDSSGRLLVGTSTALGTNNSVTIKGTASSNPSIFFGRNENASGITAGDALGFLEFGSGDGGIGAQIKGEADGTWSSTADCPSRLMFSTTADGAPSPTEQMRITSDGRVLFGTTGTPSASVTGAAFTPQTNGRMSLFSSTSSTASQKHVLFFNPNGEVGSISTNASATAYTTSSDYRLKENIIPLTGASERVLQLKPSRFNFIADPDIQVDGFIAHEAQAVVPECVTGIKDEVDEDGNPVYQGIDQAKLVPLLTAALQEALQKIEDLEARLTEAGI